MLHKNSFIKDAEKRFPIKSLAKKARLAHHPTCDKYSHHIVWIFGRAFCIGCTFFYTGFITSTILFFIFGRILIRSWIEASIIWAIGFILFLSFYPQMKLKRLMKKVKAFKMILRFNLGFGTALMISSVLIKPPFNWIGIIVRVLFAGLYYFVYKLFFKIRGKNVENYCTTCNKGIYPFCEYNYEQIKEAIQEMEEKGLQEKILYDFLLKVEEQIREKEGQELVEFVIL